MKLSNTMIMNEALLPNNKKAFTLAEVLITLSILGVVAALTIPSLVNRQNELAAITKLKKAISSYESAVEVYMAENEDTNFAGAAASGCTGIRERFKITQDNNATNAGDTCIFTTADGTLWSINSAGNAVVYDSARAPRYGVVMWARGGQVNGTQDDGINGDTRPLAADQNGGIDVDANNSPLAPNAAPVHGFYAPGDMLNISTSRNPGDNDHANNAPGDVTPTGN